MTSQIFHQKLPVIGESGFWFKIQNQSKYQIFGTFLKTRQTRFFNDLPSVKSSNLEAAKVLLSLDIAQL